MTGIYLSNSIAGTHHRNNQTKKCRDSFPYLKAEGFSNRIRGPSSIQWKMFTIPANRCHRGHTDFSPPDELSDFLYNPGRTIFPPLLPIPTSEGNKRSLTSWGTTPSVSPPIVPSENYLRGAQQQKGTDLAEAWLAQPRSSIVQTHSVSPSIVRSETSSTVFIYRIQCVI